MNAMSAVATLVTWRGWGRCSGEGGGGSRARGRKKTHPQRRRDVTQDIWRQHGKTVSRFLLAKQGQRLHTRTRRRVNTDTVCNGLFTINREKAEFIFIDEWKSNSTGIDIVNNLCVPSEGQRVKHWKPSRAIRSIFLNDCSEGWIGTAGNMFRTFWGLLGCKIAMRYLRTSFTKLRIIEWVPTQMCLER